MTSTTYLFAPLFQSPSWSRLPVFLVTTNADVSAIGAAQMDGDGKSVGSKLLMIEDGKMGLRLRV